MEKNNINLEFDKSISGLAGNEYGYDIFKKSHSDRGRYFFNSKYKERRAAAGGQRSL